MFMLKCCLQAFFLAFWVYDNVFMEFFMVIFLKYFSKSLILHLCVKTMEMYQEQRRKQMELK